MSISGRSRARRHQFRTRSNPVSRYRKLQKRVRRPSERLAYKLEVSRCRGDSSREVGVSKGATYSRVVDAQAVAGARCVSVCRWRVVDLPFDELADGCAAGG